MKIKQYKQLSQKFQVNVACNNLVISCLNAINYSLVHQ
jgi:hypothetical protein